MDTSPSFSPDFDAILQSVLALEVSPVAAEAGAALAEHWIRENTADHAWPIAAVECGFVAWLDRDTVIIGVQDLLTEDEGGILGNEWKSTKEAGRYWNEDIWFEEIAGGSQLAIYAIALTDGVYYEHGTGRTFELQVLAPRIRVRAVSKSAVPVCWPTEGDGIVTFSQEKLAPVRNALLTKAASIRAMRKTGVVPWQLPGHWCTNKYRRECEHFSACSKRVYPAAWAPFDVNDPAFTYALPFIGDRVGDPELVILGASAYAAYSECAENGRRNTLAGNKEESLALATGTALHAALAAHYRGLQSWQRGQKKHDTTTF